ncbi:MAG: carboxypeptidase regulatory-like domain-containing protein [Planctomycetota bacterium]
MEGIVLETPGRPAANVVVQLRRARATPRPARRDDLAFTAPDIVPPVLAATRSAADGRFRIPGLAHATHYAVEAVPEAPRRGSRSVIKTFPGQDAYAVLVVGAGSVLHGRVVDAGERGVRAWVSATGPHHWAVQDLETDPEGRFRVHAVPGSLFFSVLVPGRALLEHVPVLAPHEGEVIFRLAAPQGSTVMGRVTNLARKPIARAVVTVTTKPAPWRGGRDSHQRRAVTDLDGRYRVAGLWPGILYHVQVEAAGYVSPEGPGPSTPRHRPLRAGEVVTFDVTLNRGATIAGRVVDTKGRPLAGVRVTPWVIRPHGLPSGYGVPGTVTGQDGTFHLRRVPLEKLRIYAYLEGGATLGSSVLEAKVEGERLRTEIVLEPPSAPPLADMASVRGYALTAEGHPVRGAVALATFAGDRRGPRPLTTRHRVPCDGAGAFAIDGVVAQVPWRVSAFAPGYVGKGAAVVVPAEGHAEEVHLVLQRAGVVAGQVLGPEGQPLTGIRVEGRVAGKTPFGRRTGLFGRFRFDNVKPGSYQVVALGKDSSPSGESVTLDVAEGGRHEGLVLRFPHVHFLAGTVLDVSGSPVPNVTVEAIHPGAVVRRSTSTDPAGRFRFRFFSQGTYRLHVAGQVMPGTFVTGQRNVRLTYEPPPAPRVVEVVLLGPDGRVVPRGEVFVRTGPGSSPIVAWAGGGRFCAQIDAGFERIDIEVRAALDSTGRPLDLKPTRVTHVDPASSPIEIRLAKG